MKKKKLRIEDLQVSSFLTDMDTNTAQTVKGGGFITFAFECRTMQDANGNWGFCENSFVGDQSLCNPDCL